MWFLLKFLILSVLTVVLLLYSTGQWKRYNLILMAAYLLAVGIIFLF